MSAEGPEGPEAPREFLQNHVGFWTRGWEVLTPSTPTSSSAAHQNEIMPAILFPVTLFCSCLTPVTFHDYMCICGSFVPSQSPPLGCKLHRGRDMSSVQHNMYDVQHSTCYLTRMGMNNHHLCGGKGEVW